VQSRIFFGLVSKFIVTHVLILACAISKDTAFPRVQQSMAVIGMMLLHDVHYCAKRVFSGLFLAILASSQILKHSIPSAGLIQKAALRTII
jgi:hypothetical protein